MADTDLTSPPIEDERPVEGEIERHPARLATLAAVVLALGILGGVPYVIVVLALVIMIFMHELGHFLTAKRAGMKVTEFFIGFGPRIWSFRRGETEYGLKAIPAGAYVRIIGMNNLDQVDPADEARTYRQKSYGQRMSVAVAGSTMHFLMALVLAFVGLLAYGEVTERSEQDWTISQLSSADDLQAQFADVQIDPRLQQLLDEGETPASLAGLEAGDRVVAIDGEDVVVFSDLRDYIQDHPGDTVTLTVDRDGDEFTTDLTLGALTDGDVSIGYLGVAHEVPVERFGPLDAAGRSFQVLGEFSVESVKGIGRFFSPGGLQDFTATVFSSGEDVPEPNVVTVNDDSGSSQDNRIISIVGATRIGAQATSEVGIAALLRFLVLLNIFIGIFNLIPLLPFDGGHVAIATYERLREFGTGRRYYADVTRLLPFAYAVVLVMVTVGAMALYADFADPIDLSQ
jgi:membrane-associated protease RseP (regulator of RpoE activity)